MDQDDVIIKVQIDSSLSIKQKQQVYLDIINGLNDRFIPVLSIKNNDEEVFNNKVGFTQRKDV